MTSVAEQAQREMVDAERAAVAPRVSHPAPRAGVKPSAKQIYCLAHLMADALALGWPEDRAQASDLIQRLKTHAAADTTPQDDPGF